MRKKTKIYQYAFLLIGLFSLPILAFGQDLGSSNELFNNSKTKKTTKTPTKKAAPKKATVAKKTPPKIVPKTVRNTTPAKRKPTKTATKTQIAAKPPTATPPTNIVIEVGDKTTGDYDEFFERAIEEGNASRDERQYTKAEAAYLRAQSIKSKIHAPSTAWAISIATNSVGKKPNAHIARRLKSSRPHPKHISL